MLVDTHAHLDDLKYENDLDEVVTRAGQYGVTRIISMGDTMAASLNAVKIAEKYEGVFAGAGVHPQEALTLMDGDYDRLAQLIELPELAEDVKKQVEISIVYEGYIKKQLEQVERMEKLEVKLLPVDIDYDKVSSLRDEAREKLNQIRPISIGQASRISGVSPADISVLLVYLEQQRRQGDFA